MSSPNAFNPGSGPLRPRAFYQASRLDFLLTGIVIFISVLVMFTTQFKPSARGTSVRIYEDNQQTKELPLGQNALVKLRGMEIEIKNGAVQVAQSDCPRGLCRHAGWISQPGSSIVCVPNRVLVEIAGERGRTSYDAITY